MPHVLGASLFFVSAFVHMLAQTRLMYTLTTTTTADGASNLGNVRVKTLLTAIASVCVVFMVIFAPVGEEFYVRKGRQDIYDPAVNFRRTNVRIFEAMPPELVNQTLFRQYSRNYPPSASFSIAAEWVFVFCYLLYFATYANDLQDCTFILDLYVIDPTAPPPQPLQEP
ncbi:uncharacterized protein LOC144130355 [Amblyomma americanum]